jgi:hypothetical protein
MIGDKFTNMPKVSFKSKIFDLICFLDLQSGEWDSSFNLIFSQQFWIQRQCLLKAGHMRAS